MRVRMVSLLSAFLPDHCHWLDMCRAAKATIGQDKSKMRKEFRASELERGGGDGGSGCIPGFL